MARFRRRKGPSGPATDVRFISLAECFEPQVKIVATRDVSGWAAKDKGTKQKWHMKAGDVYYIDVDTAAEFITKGYATGDLPRPVSDQEKAKWRSEMTVIRPGG